MSFSTGYCTVAYANTANENSTTWDDLETAQKELAISMGKSFIDSKYTCSDSDDWDITDTTTIPEEIQYANAIMAERYSNGELFDTSDYKSGPIASKKVKAGSVETTTIYAGMYSQSVKSTDNNKDITLMISAYCSLGSSTLTRV